MERDSIAEEAGQDAQEGDRKIPATMSQQGLELSSCESGPGDAKTRNVASSSQEVSEKSSSINGDTTERSTSTDSLDGKVSASSMSGTEEKTSGSSDGQSQSQTKSGTAKRDRSNLRKGKWTVEEEEYTSRIIHYFSTGLLTLPEGATLRSYLAGKLNCDPMRITKKYAGASCLGRRMYHLRDRRHPTIAEIQLAKAELDHLERRFRMRVEEGHSGIPLPSQSDMLLSLSQQPNLMLPSAASSAGAFPNWLLALAGPIPTPDVQPVATPAASWGLPAGVPAPAPGQWLLPNTQAPAPNALGLASAINPPSSANEVDVAMANLALARAAVSLAPALTQLAAANLEQQQRQQQPPPPPPPPQQQHPSPVARIEQADMFTTQLRDAYEQHLKATGGQLTLQDLSTVTNQQPSQQAPPVLPSISPSSNQSENGKPEARKRPLSEASNEPPQAAQVQSKQRPRTEEDKAAGSILLGFLSSLRHSYEDALRGKQTTEQNRAPPIQTKPLESIARPVTDSSSGGSQQLESSIEDSEEWNSDKKTDPSSSEDSDKETNKNYSKGPPRKRLKTKKVANDNMAMMATDKEARN